MRKLLPQDSQLMTINEHVDDLDEIEEELKIETEGLNLNSQQTADDRHDQITQLDSSRKFLIRNETQENLYQARFTVSDKTLATQPVNQGPTESIQRSQLPID